MTRYNNKHSLQDSLVGLSGNQFHVSLAKMKVLLDFKSKTEMKFTMLDGGGIVPTGYNETVEVKIFTIAKELFIVGWKEKSGATVSHVEDLENQILYSNVSMPNGHFYNLIGTITPSIIEHNTDLPQRQYSEALHAKELHLDFTDFMLNMTFTKNDKIHIKWLKGADTEQPPFFLDFAVTEIRPHILLITFKEEKVSTVVLVLDLIKKTVWITITKYNSFLILEGNAKIIQL